MKTQLYMVEVGVCLPPEHHEYKYYKVIEGIDYSLYDENFAFFIEDLDKAKEYASNYVSNGVPNTYGMVLDHGLWDLEPRQVQEINNNGFADGLWEAPRKNNILWFTIKKI